MWAGAKIDYRPLLGPGRHVLTLPEIRRLCVAGFGGGGRREHLFQRFEEFLQEYLVAGISGEVWLNGSFLTEKIEPGDVDATAIIPPESVISLTRNQRQLVDATNDGKYGPDVDAFAWQWLPDGHQDYLDEARNPARTWHEQYGVENSREWLKGFAVLGLR